MNLFDVVGENFFKPFASQFRSLYLDCLTIIYDSYRLELSYGIDREILVSQLTDYFERSNISDIELDDEADILRDSRAKATAFLRKLKDFGWVEYEIANNQTARVVMPDYAVTIVQTLAAVAHPKEMEYQSEISLIYSTLTNEELLNRPYPQVLKPVFDRTRALFDGLKKLNTSIKKYIEDITADKTSEEIIRDFFSYHDEIASKAYHRIKTEDNISRFRHTILSRLRDLLNDPDVFDRAVRGYQNIEGETDYGAAEEEVRAQVSAVMDSFRSYDDLVSEIDRKHAKYLRNAVERARFLLLNSNNLEGKLSVVLRCLADGFNREEQGNLSEDAPEEVCALFNLFPRGFLSGASLKTAPLPRRTADVEEVFQPLGLTEAERAARRIVLSERNRNRFSRKNVERFVAALLADRPRVLASDIPAETRRDMIRIIFISLYGHSSGSAYLVRPKEALVSLGGFVFRDFEIARRAR